MADRQMGLFEDRRCIAPRDRHVAAEEKPRLSGQNQAILDILQRRRATNKELGAISLKYTARISDIRKAGYDIRVVSHDRKSGLVVYELVR